MVIEAHKCNGKDCNGLVVFDNADMDLLEFETKKGIYAYGNSKCNVCGKEFLIVPSYAVIDFDEETQESEEIKSVCITEWQNQKL
ncbi:hypothetical protein [Bacillus toyonensis]|uniref:Uncharacterized protein n=1 Tax=Bacillus toyonensis TaxID=155322 RepID=A0A2C4QJM1_9BACI|nr:hypothetical protein [Bacillus toyonensis]PGB04337.1 hypothetical protein COL93_03180 [Bacillus toyonensis]PHD71194.1 hypothetical protein COF40_09470 [Bacillus toyonensis]